MADIAAAEFDGVIGLNKDAVAVAKTPTPKKNPPRPKKPNYNVIHADLLPLRTVPLPPFIPHNPLSLIYLIYTYLFLPASSYAHPTPLYKGQFSPGTRSVHVTDSVSIQGLWCRGFFGKGSLSRSEPTWLTRTRRRLGIIGKDENLTAEEFTERRRIDRREFKKERAKKEQEKLKQILVEEGKITLEKMSDEAGTTIEQVTSVEISSVTTHKKSVPFDPETGPQASVSAPSRAVVDIEDLEHLQLTLEEAFFLSYGLGSFQVIDSDGTGISNLELLKLFRMHSYFPSTTPDLLQPDDPFLVSYVVYHHFRSLGWVVKTGIKFAVDYLLYNRGPAFTHAEFSVMILPSYSHSHWQDDTKRKAKERSGWHWLHCINRVSSQVKKTLILCFVEIPPPGIVSKHAENIGALLGSYKVREVTLRRWMPSRNRD